MIPLTWLDRLLWFISPWRYIQCKAALPGRGSVICTYCIRCKGHPGRHETFDGQRFDI